MPATLRRLLLALGVTLVAVVLVVGAVVLVGGGDDDAPAPDAAPPSTPMAEFDGRELAVARASFCDAVAEESVSDALAGEVEETGSYGDGERARLADGVRDVAHEYSCTWRAADGTEARAWVFAPPVTEATATALTRAAQQTEGCTPAEEARYGAPTRALTCAGDGTTEYSWRGLFGDAYLTCTLTVPGSEPGAGDDETAERAGRWCVAVATAAAG